MRINREKKKVETAEQNRQKKHVKKFAKTFQQERAKMKKQLAQKKIAETEKFKRHERKYGENTSRGVGKFGRVFIFILFLYIQMFKIIV